MPKMIKCSGTDWLHFENVFKTNQKYPNNPQLLRKSTGIFYRNKEPCSYLGHKRVNNIRAYSYLKGICII